MNRVVPHLRQARITRRQRNKNARARFAQAASPWASIVICSPPPFPLDRQMRLGSACVARSRNENLAPGRLLPENVPCGGRPRLPLVPCSAMKPHDPTVRSAGALPDRADREDRRRVDVYFSADVETDGPIPGPFSMLSFALVYAGEFDGFTFRRPPSFATPFYAELKPISEQFEAEALRVNGIDRSRLLQEGSLPEDAMTAAARWVQDNAAGGRPVLVAYPLCYDWTWLYWYFMRFSATGSPFDYSRCFDIKTAYAVKAHLPISSAGRSKLLESLRSSHPHTHHACDDAIEQAEIFANIFEWRGRQNGANS